MNAHFRAFSFVDRIDTLDAGVAVSGRYAIPPELASFPQLLVTEAIGQLGAWCAMSAVDFKYRPVAGLTEKVELFTEARPGEVLDLKADLESVDPETVVFNGTAHVGGRPIIRIKNSLGPMMPLEEFDDPAAVRDRFALLRDGGAEPGAFHGLPSIPLQHTTHEAGRLECAALQVPASAPFFADHFPRRPVFPGTLLMRANFDLVDSLLSRIPNNNHVWKLRSVSDVKFRTFTPPNASLNCEARLESRTDGTAILAVEDRDARRVVASAKALYASVERP